MILDTAILVEQRFVDRRTDKQTDTR